MANFFRYLLRNLHFKCLYRLQEELFSQGEYHLLHFFATFVEKEIFGCFVATLYDLVINYDFNDLIGEITPFFGGVAEPLTLHTL